MQTFSSNFISLVLACMMSVAHASTAEVTSNVANGVAKKALAFKRRASMTQELGNQIHRLNHSMLADDKPHAAMISSSSSAQSQQTSTDRSQKNSSTLVANDPKNDSTKSATKAPSTLPQTSFSHISSFWQSSTSADKKAASNQEKMKVFSEPSVKAKVLAQVSPAQNFSVEQGDWVKIKTSEGIVGWSLVKDVEQNITNAWADEYQVVMNGQSSNYTVTKISAEERKKRQKAMIDRQNQRLKRLTAMWEQDFFNYDDVEGRQDEIKSLKDQVMALNEQIKDLQSPKKDTA